MITRVTEHTIPPPLGLRLLCSRCLLILKHGHCHPWNKDEKSPGFMLHLRVLHRLNERSGEIMGERAFSRPYGLVERGHPTTGVGSLVRLATGSMM